MGERCASAVGMMEKFSTSAEWLEARSVHFSKNKMPTMIEIVAKLPLNTHGKADKKACLSLFVAA